MNNIFMHNLIIIYEFSFQDSFTNYVNERQKWWRERREESKAIVRLPSPQSSLV